MNKEKIRKLATEFIHALEEEGVMTLDYPNLIDINFEADKDGIFDIEITFEAILCGEEMEGVDSDVLNL